MRRDFAFVLAAGLMLAPHAFAATPGALQAEQHPSAPSEDGFGGRGGKLGGFLTPEQRAMLVLEFRDQLKDKAPQERQAFRRAQVQKLIAMSDSERQTFKADLQARWEALPPRQKARIEARLANPPGPPPSPPGKAR